jgi:hypothetical protein
MRINASLLSPIITAGRPVTCSANEKDTIVRCLTFTLFFLVFLGNHQTKKFWENVLINFRIQLAISQAIGRNHLNEKIAPLLPTGIGEGFSQIIFALLRRCELPLNESAVLTRGALYSIQYRYSEVNAYCSTSKFSRNIKNIRYHYRVGLDCWQNWMIRTPFGYTVLKTRMKLFLLLLAMTVSCSNLMFADSIENPGNEFLHIFGLCFGQRHESRGDTQLG